MLDSFPDRINAAVIGASGGIGSAFAAHLKSQPRVETLHEFSRSTGTIDITDEASIAAAADTITQPLHLLIVATGILHTNDIKPEKSLRDLSSLAMQELFAVNTIAPALIAKHFLPKIPKEDKAVIAFLSAKVGSISDNAIGGWYAYRASKAALNMMIKNAAIETARRYKQAVLIGLHPGTVDTALSKPFQGNVRHDIFSPEQSSAMMLDVINAATPEQSGQLLTYDGKEIAP